MNRKLQSWLKKQNKEGNVTEENPKDCWYFYQVSTGENIFLHNVSMKLFDQEYKDFSKLPIRIESTVEEIETTNWEPERNKKMKYLSHLPEWMPYSMVEINMDKLVNDKVISPQVHKDNFKHLK